MRILVGHNYYQQSGGEDFLFNVEARMLRDFGHDVMLYERHNNEIKFDVASKLQQLSALRFSKRTYTEVSNHIKSFKPDVVHFHNTFYVITPSAFAACQDLGVPVVVSLHNFRLMCINGLFFRNNEVCEKCAQGSRLPGIIHRCHQGSLLTSIFINDMIAHHWHTQTWVNQVNQYIVATEFSRQKHLKAGIPSEKVTVIPHFVDDPGKSLTLDQRGNYALYAGRLSQEKGLELLLRSWRQLKDIPLYIVGKGPLYGKLKQYIKDHQMSHVHLLGFLEREEYQRVFAKARFLVVPCLCYDNFPMVIVEAYSYGVPVLATRIGTLETCVREHQTGLLFSLNNENDLIEKARRMNDEATLDVMCKQSRVVFEQEYTAKHHYDKLIQVYQKVCS